MKTGILFYTMLICLFLFSCGNDKETDKREYEYLMPITNYKDRTGSEKCTNIPRPTDTYTYPVIPETEEWIQLHNKGINEVIKACQVPQYVLSKQSTQAVIQTFFDYPLSFDVYASNSTLLEGFKKSVVYNSAYAELLKREDAGKYLLERYILYNPVGCDIAIIMTPLIELLPAQPEFYSQLNVNEKKSFVKEALHKLELRIAYDPALAHHNETTCLLMGRIMASAKFDPFVKELNGNKNLAIYLENQSHEFKDYDIILSYATQFIK